MPVPVAGREERGTGELGSVSPVPEPPDCEISGQAPQRWNGGDYAAEETEASPSALNHAQTAFKEQSRSVRLCVMANWNSRAIPSNPR